MPNGFYINNHSYTYYNEKQGKYKESFPLIIWRGTKVWITKKINTNLKVKTTIT